jgi:hypothetical protein
MSDLRVTNLKGRTSGSAPKLPDGAVVTGVTTSTSFDGDVTGNVTGTAATFTTVEATTYIGVTPGGTDITSCLFT